MTIIETARTVVDQVAASPAATTAVSAPPMFVTATSLFGVSWGAWVQISMFAYTLMLIAGVLWKWVSTWRRWLRERKAQ